MIQKKNDPIRLQVRLARCGVASRRKCEKLIAAGRITVNGTVVMQQGTKVLPTDEIKLDGRVVRPETNHVYIALHKPTGFLCSNDDKDGRPLAKSLLEASVKERIFYVGRLDYLTSGLIFYTNDGEFAQILTHPSSRIEKEYIITAKSDIPAELPKRFERGITVDGVCYRAAKAELTGDRRARIVLTEGKNRELRQVFQSAGIHIKNIQRIRIGSVLLKGTAPGHFRYLKISEVDSLLSKGGMRREYGNRN